MSTAQAVLASWPFGRADVAPAVKTVTTEIRLSTPTPRIDLVVHRSDAPSLSIEEHSVPSIGPNPFLAAARMLHARDAVNAL